jgi:hypothetical protein
MNKNDPWDPKSLGYLSLFYEAVVILRERESERRKRRKGSNKRHYVFRVKNKNVQLWRLPGSAHLSFL